MREINDKWEDKIFKLLLCKRHCQKSEKIRYTLRKIFANPISDKGHIHNRVRSCKCNNKQMTLFSF